MSSVSVPAVIGAVALALLVGACSSSATAPTVDATGLTTVAVPASSATTSSSSSTAAATTAASTAAPAAATTLAAPAAIVPEVVCVDTSFVRRPPPGPTTTIAGTDTSVARAGPDLAAETLVYFAYRNPTASPVVVPLGDGNRLEGADPADDPLLPTVFAPGRVSPTFLAIVAADGAVPTWTLRGTDGVVRTAAPTAATPACDGSERATSPDTRAPQVTVTFGDSVIGTPSEPRIAVTVRMTGLPASSVCPTGLTPRPPVVQFRLAPGVGGGELELTAEGDGTALAELAVGPLPFATVAVSGVRVRVDTFVADRCEAGGVVTTAWATSPGIDALASGLGATCAVAEGTAVRPATSDECVVLGATGGIRIRRVLF